MSFENYYKLLSDEAKAEFVKLVKNKESAYDMLLGNYLSYNTYSYGDISSRLQIQYFALNLNIKNVQTKGINGWQQYEVNQPNQVARNIIPLLNVENSRGMLEKYYSSFAVKEVENNYKLRYPLDDDLTESISPFVREKMNNNTYNQMVEKIKNGFGITINNVSIDLGNNIGFAQNARDKFKRLFSKEEENSYSGIITIADRTKKGYEYSNIEKLIKIYDEVAEITINKNMQSYKDKLSIKITPDIKFAARVFATLLLSRITDYNNPEINAKAEKCLWLQFANIINRAEFSSNQLTEVTELGSNVASTIVEKLGYTKDEIVEIMEQNKYSYDIQPSNTKEALLYATESNYDKYIVPLYESLKNNYQNTQNKPNNAENEKKKEDIKKDIKALLDLVGPDGAKEIEDKHVLMIDNKDNKKDNNKEDNNDEAKMVKDGEVIQLGTKKYSDKKPLPIVYKPMQDKDDTNGVNGFSFNKNAVKQNTVDKIIDDMVEKALSDKAISIARHIGARDYSEYKGKDNCEKVCAYLSNTLMFYKDLQTSKRHEKMVKAENYTSAQKFAVDLNNIKITLTDAIINYNKSHIKEENEKLITYINKAYKDITNSNVTIRENFKTVINRYAYNFAGLSKNK